jgi:hypothetical protein
MRNLKGECTYVCGFPALEKAPTDPGGPSLDDLDPEESGDVVSLRSDLDPWL